MSGFIDEAIINVISGNGGPGSISFRREKYVPNGGPDGGDGGKGANVVFKVKNNLKTLSGLRYKKTFAAENGKPGTGCKRHGKDGVDTVIPVPPGTIIKDPKTDEIIKDLTDLSEGQEWVFLKGGKGGLGNTHFATSKKQAPRYAQPGLFGLERTIKVELNIIADIGFVGLPNAGKSSLLDRLTNASPKIAGYPFTTKIPNLGVFILDGEDVVLADIPGIIEGASSGAGLGIKFLKHISRTGGLLFLIDLSDETFEKTFHILLNELETFSKELSQKKRIILGTKTDLFEPEEATDRIEKLKQLLPEEKIYSISVFSGQGIENFRTIFYSLLDKNDSKNQ